jgi:hypothetical protein
MRRLLFLIVVTILQVPAWSQNKSASTITVVGKDVYSEVAEAYGIKVYFEENPNKCDPVVGFLSLEDQIGRFSEALGKLGIDFSAFTSMPDDLSARSDVTTRHKTFRFTHKNPEVILQIADLSRAQVVRVLGIFTVFARHSFEDEDLKAVNALKDARRKATVLAKKAGKKLGNILNIDDDTTLSSFGDLDSVDDTDMFEELFYRFSALLSLTQEEYTRFSRDGAYSLKVTFELR